MRAQSERKRGAGLRRHASGAPFQLGVARHRRRAPQHPAERDFASTRMVAAGPVSPSSQTTAGRDRASQPFGARDSDILRYTRGPWNQPIWPLFCSREAASVQALHAPRAFRDTTLHSPSATRRTRLGERMTRRSTKSARGDADEMGLFDDEDELLLDGQAEPGERGTETARARALGASPTRFTKATDAAPTLPRRPPWRSPSHGYLYIPPGREHGTSPPVPPSCSSSHVGARPPAAIGQRLHHSPNSRSSPTPPTTPSAQLLLRAYGSSPPGAIGSAATPTRSQPRPRSVAGQPAVNRPCSASACGGSCIRLLPAESPETRRKHVLASSNPPTPSPYSRAMRSPSTPTLSSCSGHVPLFLSSPPSSSAGLTSPIPLRALERGAAPTASPPPAKYGEALFGGAGGRAAPAAAPPGVEHSL